jgi:hypothetical protein
MTDKAIEICALMTALAVTAIVFVRRAMRYRKALGAAVPENEVIPEAETPPEVQPEPEPEFEASPEEPSARDVYLSRYIQRNHIRFKRGRVISVRPEYHALIKFISGFVGGDCISLSAYLDGVLKANFDENWETISHLVREKADGQPNADE